MCLYTEKKYTMNEAEIKYWEFEFEVSGSTSVVLLNAAVINCFCSALAPSDGQVVTKIVRKQNLVVDMITNGYEAEMKLLKDYSDGVILQELQSLMGAFYDFQFQSMQLTKTGIVFDASESEFESIKNEADKILQDPKCGQGIREIIFSSSSVLTDDNKIILQYLTPEGAKELIRNTFAQSDKESKLAAVCTADMEQEPSPLKTPLIVSALPHSFGENSRSRSSSSDSHVLTPVVERALVSEADQASTSLHVEEPTCEALDLRPYQVELAQPGLKGKNCVIVAPTGSGKTHVAVKICLEHIKVKENARVLFLVPRVALVKQQYEVFRKFVPKEVFEISGESTSTVPVSVFVKKHAVSVMTAQIFLNLLSNKELNVEEITLLMFDECHHTTKNHTYNGIMRMYMDKKFGGANQLPQIVGLTASPGVGKAKTMEKAEETVMTLMANLDVTIAPVKVVKHVENLKKFQHETEHTVCRVEKFCDDAFAQCINKKMTAIERMIGMKRDEYFNVISIEEAKFNTNARHGTQEYEAWTVDLLKSSKLIEDKAASRWLMALSNNLREYNTSLILNDHVRGVDANDYLLENLFPDPPRNEVEGAMSVIYYNPEPNPTTDVHHPMLEKLRSILVAQYRVKPDTRCIVFVKTRAIAKSLLSYLNDQDDLKALNSMQMTGTNAKADNFGMTKTGQEDTLKAFRVGAGKILVATSVAEEGLDIATCNLIITYNYSTNEVGLVQRIGRARAKDSRFIILAYQDSGNIERENLNKERIELAKLILEKLQSMDPHILQSQICKIQMDLKKERDSSLLQKSIMQNTGTTYQFLCLGCKNYVTSSKNIQHINMQHRVVVDVGFRNRALIVPYAPQQISADEYNTGKIRCADPQCSHPWGTRMLYKKVSIYVLKISNFVLTDNDKYRENVPQWKKVPFDSLAKELDLTELLALQSDDDAEDIDIDIDDDQLFDV